jgi:RNA polymerase sigma-70 factor (ECF subfamily)
MRFFRRDVPAAVPRAEGARADAPRASAPPERAHGVPDAQSARRPGAVLLAQHGASAGPDDVGAPERAAREEFARLALAHLDALHATALRLTRSSADADDLVQDTFLKAHRFYDHYEAGTNLKAWLFKILTNTFINKYRRATLERDVLDGVDQTPVGEGVMSNAALRALCDPDGTMLTPLVSREIRAALDRLPDDYRTMILLADVEELSYKEIADIVGCPIGTVMSRLHRARKQLQAQLLAQAIELGIVVADAPGAVASGAGAADGCGSEGSAVSLDRYRARRARGA